MRRSLLVSIGDQALNSAVSLLLSLWLIAVWPPERFGAFGLIVNLAFIAQSLHNALAGAHLPVLLAGSREDEERRRVAAMLSLVTIATAALSGLFTVASLAAADPSGALDLLAAASAYVAIGVVREHLRLLGFSLFLPGRVLIADLACHAVMVLVLLAVHGLEPPSLALVFWALAAGSLMGALVGLLPRRRLFLLRADRDLPRRLASLWREQARWAVAGVLVGQAQSRGYIFLVGAIFGLAAVGVVNAALMILRPLNLLLTAWAAFARPRLARHYAQGEGAAAHRLAHVSAAGFAVATLCYGAVLLVAWPYLTAHVFEAAYVGIAAAVALCLLASLMTEIRYVYALELQTVPRFREAFVASAAGCAVVFVAFAALLAFEDPAMSFLALALGETAALVVAVRYLRGVTHAGRGPDGAAACDRTPA
ncbi:hypothetical protein [Marinivivus vitaminiproducens]|uniref:hypothetical protein n=1 Tax=Marinivivus vitaminiproducens TaxID=3035935 RepID=UPI00279B29A2|nr:hypothetical protein P4R82_22940 [Geminicoccaceae bacterium SCSIO 64248]